MIRPRPSRFRVAAAATCVGLLALAGCATEPPGQSQPEACQLISVGLSSLSVDVSDALTKLTAGDIGGAQAVYAKLSESMQALSDRIENAPVKSALAAVQGAVESLSSSVDSLASDGARRDPATVAAASVAGETAVTQLKANGDALNGLCAAR